MHPDVIIFNVLHSTHPTSFKHLHIHANQTFHEQSYYFLHRSSNLETPPPKSYIALNPPSRLSTQLLAYLLAAKKTAASAISVTSPKRERGMAFSASLRARSVMALMIVLVGLFLLFLFKIFFLFFG